MLEDCGRRSPSATIAEAISLMMYSDLTEADKGYGIATLRSEIMPHHFGSLGVRFG